MFTPEPIKNPHSERTLYMMRLVIAALAFCAVIGLLIGRLYYLQLARGDYYTTRSNNNRVRVQAAPPVRGLIYDRNGVLLADNVPSYRLEIVPEQVKDMDGVLSRLSQLVALSKPEIDAFRERLKNSPKFAPVPLKFQLDMKEVARFEVNRQRFPGVDIRAGLSRNYPLGKLTAQVVGYVGAITQAELRHIDMSRYRGTGHIGKVGVEKSYEDLLHGMPGSRIAEVNAEGRVLRQLDSTHSVPGKTLYLTIDVNLQRAAAEALQGQSGAVVVLDTNTGEVLALASEPSYNPQPFVEGISQKTFSALLDDPLHPMFNRTLRGQYPPGSTIKPLVALAGLETGDGSSIHERYCPGYYELPGARRRWHDWKRSGHGHVTLRDAIMESCDVYFYDVAHDLGIEQLDAFLSRFGLGQPTGIDMPGEQPGILPSPAWKRAHRGKPWYPGETLNTGIGQGYMTTTPLQLAHAVALIATHGHGMRPHVARAIKDNITGEIKQIAPEPMKPITFKDPSHWQRVIDGMVAVVQNRHGTAHHISKGMTYTMAGKTGTSQVRGNDRNEGEFATEDDIPRKFRTHALFVAFAPVEHPQIAIAVIVEHAGGGGAVAAPIARKVADVYFAEQRAAP